MRSLGQQTADIDADCALEHAYDSAVGQGRAGEAGKSQYYYNFLDSFL
jgi:hypothetical protein